MKKTQIIIWLSLFALMMMPMAADCDISIYIAPDGDDNNDGSSMENAFQTLERAKQELIELKRDGLDQPVAVLMKGGVYPITEPLVLTPEISGTEEYPITFRSYGNKRALIHGGKKITGWQKAEGELWKVTLPEVKNEGWNFRQLFIDGELRTRARIPNEGFLRVAGFPDGGRDIHYHTDCQRFEYAPGDINPNWKNLKDVEVIVYHFWTDSHLPIQSIDEENNIVTFQHKAGKVFTDDFTSDGARYIVENVFEGLDQPGEWYLNQKTRVLYYYPYPDENMSKVNVVAPVSPAFVHFVGNPLKRNYVEHITFENIDFEYSHFLLPKGNSNDRQGSASVDAAITMKGARYCKFDHCGIRNLGTFVFEIGDGCSHNEFVGNTMEHIGAGGFRVNGGDDDAHPLTQTSYNVITDNVLAYYGDEFPSAVGILLQHTFGNEVKHNLIHHGWYTGISIGWNWGYQRSISRDNKIEYNHIHHIGQGLLSDMGGIYTLGVSPGTTIRNNKIHDVEANHYGGWGIYNDEGSTHILIENNVVYNTKFAGYNIHFSKEITVRNNIFAFGRLQQLSRSRVEPHKSVYFENNIVYWKEGVLFDNNWQDKEYEMYYHPKNESGTRKVKSTFEVDYNLYYNPTKRLNEVEFNKQSFEEWQERGKDEHSMYADPMFFDAGNYDFRLKDESPAFELGFKPIDMDAFGPRE